MISTINMSKKIITELTDEELINILESSKDKDNESFDATSWHNDVIQFLSFYRLKSGNKPITSGILYKLYKQWSKTPLTRMRFTMQTQDFLANKSQGICVYFYLNVSEGSILKKLIKHLKGTSKIKEKSSKKHFDNFLNKYSIKLGTFFVKDIVLYNLYDKWCYEIKKKMPFSLSQFKAFCKLYFKYKIVDNENWYSVDQSIVQFLTEEMIYALKNKKVTLYDKKKNKKIQR